MNALGPISRFSAVPMTLPTALPVAGQGTDGSRAAAKMAEPAIRLDIRRDESIDRIVFEYRKLSDGELVQRFPARQVVQFYQRIEAIAEADTTGVQPTAERTAGAAEKTAGDAGRAELGGRALSDGEVPTLDLVASGDGAGGRLQISA